MNFILIKRAFPKARIEKKQSRYREEALRRRPRRANSSFGEALTDLFAQPSPNQYLAPRGQASSFNRRGRRPRNKPFRANEVSLKPY